MTRKLFLAVLPTIALTISLTVWALGAATASPTRISVIIGFDRPPAVGEEVLIQRLNGSIKYKYRLIPAIAAEVPEEAVDALGRNPNVAYVEDDLPRHVHDLELDNSWGVNRIDAEEVHDLNNRGVGAKVAIIDTGIDCTHPDLDTNCAGGFNFVAKAGFPNDIPFDDHGHGTHVAGILAAEDDNTDLLDSHPGVVGVAPEADLYALKVCDSSAICPTSNIIAALEWVTDPDGNPETDDHLDIANISLGSRFASTAEELAVQAAYDAGVLLVASAGNSGNCSGRNDSVEYPAGYAEVIAVAATNRDDLRPCFSSTGADVELAAPGVDVLSTVPTGSCSLCDSTGYRRGSGTSMASPHVAGAAALVIAGIAGGQLEDLNGDGQIDNRDVRLRLRQTADDLGVSDPDIRYGHGLVDAEEAALGTENGDDLPPVPAPTPTPVPTNTPVVTTTATPTVTPTPAKCPPGWLRKGWCE